MSEYLTLAVLTTTGWTLVRSAGLCGWGAIPLGYLAGVFVAVAVGLVALIADASTVPFALLAGVAAVGAVAFLVERQRFDRRDIAVLAWTLMGLAVLVGVLREAHLVSYHIDSFRYLLAGSLVAQNLAVDVGPAGLWTKRMFVAPVLHAFAHGHGEVYLRAVTPIFALATAASLVWFVRAASRTTSQRFWSWFVAVTAMVLLVSINRYVWHAFYINSHLFTGGAFVVLAAAGWLLTTRAAEAGRGMALLAVLAIPTVVVGRPEGFVMAGLALLPTLTSDRISARLRAVLLIAFGIATAGWHMQMALTYSGRLPLSVVGPLVLGLAAIVLAPFVRSPLLTRWAGLVRGFALASLFVLLGAFALRDPGLLVDSLAATYANVTGAGSWGPTMVVLALVVAATVALHRGATLASLRFPLLASVPMVFILAYLRDAAYRVGDGDSLNRMLIQFVPLVVLYLAAAACDGRWGLRRPRWRRGQDAERPEEGGALP